MNEKTARALVAERSGGICEIFSAGRATNWHHRQNRGRGQVGQWTPSNGLHLCGSGTTGCHGHVTANPLKAREKGWSVPSWADPARTPVWLARMGWVFLGDDGSIEEEDAA